MMDQMHADNFDISVNTNGSRDRLLQILSRRYVLPMIVALGISLISILAVFNGAPYDDEIFNFRLIQDHDLIELIYHVNMIDVHPPGSYVINKLLFDVLGSWNGVKLFGGFLNACCLALFLDLTFGTLDTRQRAILSFLLVTSASMVMWGASVRWYAYFNPVFALTFGLLMFSKLSRTARAIILTSSAVLLFYVGYIAFLAVPLLVFVHFARDYRELRWRDFATLAFLGCVALALCLPQLDVFLHVHMQNRGAQVSSPKAALAATAMTLLLGNAVFPIAALPAVFGATAILAFVYLVFSKQMSSHDVVTMAALVVGTFVMVVTGVGGKARNSVFLLPLVALVFSSAIAALPARLALVVGGVLVAFQAQGIANTVLHRNTIRSHTIPTIIEHWTR